MCNTNKQPCLLLRLARGLYKISKVSDSSLIKSYVNTTTTWYVHNLICNLLSCFLVVKTKTFSVSCKAFYIEVQNTNQVSFKNTQHLQNMPLIKYFFSTIQSCLITMSTRLFINWFLFYIFTFKSEQMCSERQAYSESVDFSGKDGLCWRPVLPHAGRAAIRTSVKVQPAHFVLLCCS